MSETWHELAHQARRAASKLVGDEPRSCVSRAYYAVYAKVTHELNQLPSVTFAERREAPSHPGIADDGGPGDGGIRRLIERAMTGLPPDRRRRLSQLVGELYALRVDADYRPSRTVDVGTARRALALMTIVFSLL